MRQDIQIINHSDRVEALLAPYKDAIGVDYDAYRAHIYRVLSFSMHFLKNDETYRPLVETALVYHDIGLWTDGDLAYLEPSEHLALRDNQENNFGLDPDALVAAIHWHHKITAYKGQGADLVNAIRKADWVEVSQGKLRKGLSKAQIKAVHDAIPDHGFPDTLQRLTGELGGSAIGGTTRLLRHVFKI